MGSVGDGVESVADGGVSVVSDRDCFDGENVNDEENVDR
jgi:hypothetical protein